MEFFMITLRQIILSITICLCVTASALQTPQKPSQPVSYVTKFTSAAQQLLPIISRASHSIGTKIGTKNIIAAATLAGITGLLGISPIRHKICSYSSQALLKLSSYAEAPLHIAVLGGHSIIVKLLLLARANKDRQAGIAEHTPLHIAILTHRPEIVQLLVKARVDLEQGDKNRRTPLMLAVMGGHDDLVEILLKAGANKDAKDCEGKNALQLIAGCLQPENMEKIVRLLSQN